MPLRVLLADDHVLVRDGIKITLESNGLTIVGEASEGREAVKMVRDLKPDVAVFDVSMPGLNGVDAARIALKENPGTKVVLLTVHTENEYVDEALRAGVSGYVLKKQATADLIRAIQEVSLGNIYLSPGISRAVMEAFRSGKELAARTLTAREREVLQLIAEGKTTKEIGSVLGISVKTAETHRSRVMDKLEIRDTAGLVRYAIRMGLVTP
ncbi:MAG: response regulator transcription factor [Candidatus Eisenbacteria bacterium]|uniref:Response regulator transcription factor n=2 Tax=Eiseniibacteriota bacterium TaxID=2212470 RepID=A0A538T430_UNCEI|nr:MAG: response regulator transcription factor [Candidatus Eisenbacteria bacterium]